MWFLENSNSNPSPYLFSGNEESIVSFVWRRINSSSLELLTWSKDQVLRCFKVPSAPPSSSSSSTSNSSTLPSQETSSDKPKQDGEHQLHHQQKSVPSSVVISEVSSSITNLAQEFSKMSNITINGVKFNQVNRANRMCSLSIKNKEFSLGVRIQFPSHYPFNASPSFEFFDYVGISLEESVQLQKTMVENANGLVSRNLPCLEQCLRRLSEDFFTLTNKPKPKIPLLDPTSIASMSPETSAHFLDSHGYQPEFSSNPSTEEHEDDEVNDGEHHNTELEEELKALDIITSKKNQTNDKVKDPNLFVPFPRLSAATFNSNGYLVYFKNCCFNGQNFGIHFNQSNQNTANSEEDEDSTSNMKNNLRTYDDYKRALTTISKGQRIYDDVTLTNLEWSYLSRSSDAIVQKSKNLRSSSRPILGYTARVGLLDTLPMLGISIPMAKSYTLSLTGQDISEICKKNKMTAMKFKRPDLVQTWQLLESITHPYVYKPFVEGMDVDQYDTPWAQHPFGRKMVDQIYDFYENIMDIQSLAMITCVLRIPEKLAMLDIKKKTKQEVVYIKASSKAKLPTMGKKDFAPNITSASSSSKFPVGGYSNLVQSQQLSRRKSVDNIDLKLNSSSSSSTTTKPLATMKHSSSSTNMLEQSSATLSRKTSQNFTSDSESSSPTTSSSYGSSGSIPTSTKTWSSASANNNTNNTVTKYTYGYVVSKEQDKGWESLLEKLERQQAIERLINATSLLDPQKLARYDSYCLAYADILHHCGLNQQHAEITKFVHNNSLVDITRTECQGLDIKATCSKCSRIRSGTTCENCQLNTFHCVICHLFIKGPGVVCLLCGHGGHSDHMRQWWNIRNICPVNGCGCRCLTPESQRENESENDEIVDDE
eukprot:TRINITY_DN6614_c0_g1_i2.p1 TRINITY_DN6614_c0_g1~~TRINITY_DN6614_c0_g1_i2.p1  ORF type:complete len:880 (+),score=187.68 TRINITY_DN6614_c0_g1_i2:820-3459(+)